MNGERWGGIGVEEEVEVEGAPVRIIPLPPLPSIPVFNSMCSCAVLSWRLACRLVGSTIGHLGVRQTQPN